MERDPTEWVSRGKIEVKGPDKNAPDLLYVVVPLEQRQYSIPGEWKEAFLRPEGIEIPNGMGPPRFGPEGVVVRCPDAELERYITNIDERIEYANRIWVEEILPRHRLEAASAEAEAEKQRNRIAEAQRRADRL